MKFNALFRHRHFACAAQPILHLMDSVFKLIHKADKRKLIMRINLTVFLLTFSLLQVSAAGYAQKITLTKSNATLTEVFREIRKQSGYGFLYAAPQHKLSGKINISVKDEQLTAVLEKCLFNQPFTYEIRNETIIIKERTGSVQERRILGRVVDVQNQPMPGVTILIKGSKILTQTNVEGRFSLLVPEGSAVLIVRSLGFKTQEVPITSLSVYAITMLEDQQDLKQVVVNGVFERPEGNLTGAVKSFSGEELKQVSSNNLFAAVAALDPSFRIIANNELGGNINQLPEIQLRGANSFPNLSGELSANPNAPLFILDGFEVTLQRVFDLDMNMIKSVTLLKDASATSIYGSRGANGVMVLNTVPPKAGKLQITYNNDFRLSTPDLSVYNLLNARDKLDFEKRAGVYQAVLAKDQFNYDQIYNNRLIAIAGGVNTDWLAEPVKTGTSNRSSLYIQGGDDYVRYGLQLAADLQSGVMKGQNRQNYSGQFDLSYSVKKFRFQNSIRLYQNVSNESPYGSFEDYAKLNPYWSPYDTQGNVVRIFETNALGTFTNPMYNASLNTINKTQYFGVSNNFQARYSASPNFFVESNFSLNKQNGSADQFYSAQNTRFATTTDVARKGSYTVNNNSSFGFESLTTANFTKRYGKNLIFSTLGFNVANSSTNYYTIATEGFPFDRLDNLLFAAQYLENSRPAGNESTVRRLGALFNTNYSYNDRYLADFSYRKDGSSQFGAEKRYGAFWSTGLGWNVHNEDFLKGNLMVNRLKLRASYGSSGSLNIPAYSAQTRYSFGVDEIYDGQLGTSIMGLGNNDLGWQDVRTLNLGTDLVFLKERLDFRFDFYKSNTKNTITSITLAPSTGFSSYSENLGRIQNTGYEISARYKIIDQREKGIVWSVNVNAFTNKNILKELSNKLKATNAAEDELNTAQIVPNLLFQEGQSINTIYVVQSLGVDPTTGTEVFLKKNGVKTFTWNAADKVAFGVTDPKWNGTFGTNLSYKGFDVGLIFSYRYGGQIYNQTLIDKVESVNPLYNVDQRAYNLGWKGIGDESLYTRIGTNSVATRLTSRFVQDENTLNLSSASFTYNFYRHAFVKKLGLKTLQLTTITNDLFRLSTVQIERGTTNPFARTFSLSLRAGF